VSDRAKNLANRLNSFNEEVISFVESCSQADWEKICVEEWPVGVTARHIGANHYTGAMALVETILKGEKFPEITAEQVTETANRHAREHAGCTKSDVLDVLRDAGRKIVSFTAGLKDFQLDKKFVLPMTGSEMSLEQFLETVILYSAGKHFKSVRAAAGK